MIPTTVSYGELLNAAKKCREAQRAYFRSRTQANLHQALALEKKMDEIIAGAERQAGLFDTEEGAFG